MQNQKRWKCTGELNKLSNQSGRMYAHTHTHTGLQVQAADVYETVPSLPTYDGIDMKQEGDFMNIVKFDCHKIAQRKKEVFSWFKTTGDHNCLKQMAFTFVPRAAKQAANPKLPSLSFSLPNVYVGN